MALAASIGPTAAGLISISESFAQNPLPPPAPGTAEVERVIVTAEAEPAIVTGSKIPTAEEIGSNPVFSLNRDLNATVHMLDGFWEEIYAKKFDGFWKQHYVHPTWFTDAQLSYSLIFTPPVEVAPVPGYSKGGKEVVGKEKEAPPTVAYSMPCWKTILNNSTITVGVNNIFGEDPPKEFGQEAVGNSTGYPGFSYDNLGRFWYVRLIKKF